MEEVAVDGLPIAYRAAGNGPPVVLLHGATPADIVARRARSCLTAGPRGCCRCCERLPRLTFGRARRCVRSHAVGIRARRRLCSDLLLGEGEQQLERISVRGDGPGAGLALRHRYEAPPSHRRRENLALDGRGEPAPASVRRPSSTRTSRWGSAGQAAMSWSRGMDRAA